MVNAMTNMMPLPVPMTQTTFGSVYPKPTNRKPKRRKRAESEGSPRKPAKLMLESTRHEFRVDWNDIQDAVSRSAYAGIDEITTLCIEHGKDEFVVENIAPNYNVGVDDPIILLRIQERIVNAFLELASPLPANRTEYRLSRRRNNFDLRFYVGRTRPTDCKVPDDDQ